MRICLVVSSRYSHTQKWVSYFAGRGNEVHVISWDPTEIDGAVVHHLVPTRESASIPVATNGVQRWKDKAKCYLRSNSRIYSLRGRIREASHKWSSFKLAFRCKRIIREIKPDIVHGHGLVNNAFYAAMSDFRPLVVSAWGSDILVHVPRSRFYRFLARYAVRKADIVTVDSAAAEAILDKMKVPKKKIATFPWGIDCKLFSPGYQDEVAKLRRELGIDGSARVVLSPRSMAPLYNIKAIVAAISEVMARHPEAIFIFLRGYGTPEYEKELKDEASRLGVIDQTRFVSHIVTQSEMAVFYNMADLLVSIPHSDSMPVSLREGMACGCIPLVSDIEANRELIRHGENGFIMEKDGGNLASGIIHCLDNLAELKGRIAGINRQLIVRHHDWEETARIMEDIYFKLARDQKFKQPFKV